MDWPSELCTDRQPASDLQQGGLEVANHFGLVEPAFTVPAWHSIAFLVASEEMFAGRAALEVV